MKFIVRPSDLGGAIAVPTSKSHSMRAILFASLAEGESLIRSQLPSPDSAAMIEACRLLGAIIHEEKDSLSIIGAGNNLRVPEQVIDVGNSGQVLRFVAAIAARIPQYTVLTGDTSICTIRPMNPLIEAISQTGAFAVSTKNDGHAPIIIKGPAQAAAVTMDGKDSQPVSAMLILGGFLEGTTTITVTNPGEQPWIDLTLYWLDKLGIPYTNKDYTRYTVTGPVSLKGFDYTVPGDWSSAAFPVAAAIVQNAPISLLNMDYSDPQGDKAILDVFRKMGAVITVDEAAKKVEVHKHAGLKGAVIDVNHIIDAVPVLASVACFAEGETVITGAEIARHKECDRLHAIAVELGKMGARIEEFDDGLRIAPAQLHGAETESWHDHRIAMAVAVAALAPIANSETVINDTACVAKSFPGFANCMASINATVLERV